MSRLLLLPGDILSLIFSRLPVRSVLACKCVSKSWLTLISTQEFIEMHLHNYPRDNNSTCLMFSSYDEHALDNQTTLIYSICHDSLASLLLPQIDHDDDDVEIEDNNYTAVEIEEEDLSAGSGIDDNAARMSYPFRFLQLTVDLFGSCNGIVCLWYHDERDNDGEDFFCLWNPATKDYRRMSQAPGRYVFSEIKLCALVYDPAARDYKFVFAVSCERNGMNSLVHVYSSSSDSWKSFLTPHYFLETQKYGVLFNGDLHWWASNSIVSLDIANEKFIDIQPPSESLAILQVGVLQDCLCMLVENYEPNANYEPHAIEIWAMQVYGDPKSWTKRYTITHEIITQRFICHVSPLRFMWSFKNGVILFTDSCRLILYDPERDTAIESPVNYMSVEIYSESLVSLNSYLGGSAYTELRILRNNNPVLEASIAELKACKAQLEARNAELERQHHEFQVAELVNSQKEAEEGEKDDEEEVETDMTKKKGQKRKMGYQYNTRKASKAVRAMLSSPRGSTCFEDESLTVKHRAEKELAKPAPLSSGGTLEGCPVKEGSKTRSTSKDSYETMTVEGLRHRLKQKGLKVTGKKAELIARLRGK